MTRGSKTLLLRWLESQKKKEKNNVPQKFRFPFTYLSQIQGWEQILSTPLEKHRNNQIIWRKKMKKYDPFVYDW